MRNAQRPLVLSWRSDLNQDSKHRTQQWAVQGAQGPLCLLLSSIGLEWGFLFLLFPKTEVKESFR